VSTISGKGQLGGLPDYRTGDRRLHDTFRRVFMLIDPDAFQAGFTAWVGSLADRLEREVVAIDGKTVRRSFDHGREQSALHAVSVWASAAWTASRTRSPPCRSCWTSLRWRTAS